MTGVNLTRRALLTTAGAAVVAAQLSSPSSRAAAKYTRYKVSGANGQKKLASYAKGVEAMLKLPADNPRNWFRNAFIHLMDCPHGNWWFYVWHRGYLGYVERTIRELSGDSSFTLPYWDWTDSPQLPDGMFDGALTPTDAAFASYTKDLGAFTSFIKPVLNKYFDSLSPAQRAQLDKRNYKDFNTLWNDVTGNGDPSNEAFAATDRSRYPTRGNPNLDGKTTYNVSPFIIESGLRLASEFNHPQSYISFTSSKTASHHDNGANQCILEYMPHNKVHNFIGGVGHIDPPYGSMTNFLSPVDPIFFLHHSNMDRLWDVWTRKQKSQGLPYLPAGGDLKTFSDEPFLFFVDGSGHYVTDGKAGDYLNTEVFDYDYEPGFGDTIAEPVQGLTAQGAAPPIEGTVSGNVASVTLPRASVEKSLAATLPKPLTAMVTLARPAGSSNEREFDILVNAPPGPTQVSADSPYYAGTIAFFGPTMHRMNMSMDATVVFPLPNRLQAFATPDAASSVVLNIQVVPSSGKSDSAPTLRALSVAPS
jgi:tyrosinase